MVTIWAVLSVDFSTVAAESRSEPGADSPLLRRGLAEGEQRPKHGLGFGDAGLEALEAHLGSGRIATVRSVHRQSDVAPYLHGARLLRAPALGELQRIAAGNG